MTDIHVQGKIVLAIDEERYESVRGGIMIGTGGEVPTGDILTGDHPEHSAGTLGCIATDLTSGNTVGLTNWHVLFRYGGDINGRVYQPSSLSNRDNVLQEMPPEDDNSNVIGRIREGILNEKVDCGVFIIDRGSCGCGGIGIDNIIQGMDIKGFNGIRGTSKAELNKKVFMIGHKSSPRIQRGRIVEVDFETDDEEKDPTYDHVSDSRETRRPRFKHHLKQQIKIRPDYSDLSSEEQSHIAVAMFGDHGDSGAVVLNEHSEVIGLYWGSDDGPNPDNGLFYGYANHIQAVIDELQKRNIYLSINTTSLPEPGVETASGHAVQVSNTHNFYVTGETSIDFYAALGNVAPALLALLNRHEREIIELIHHHRPVTVTWQRNKGPAYIVHLINSLREPGYSIPAQIDGVALEKMLSVMSDVLQKHGSKALQQDLERLSPPLIYALSVSSDIDSLLSRLAEVIV
jgi:hypothetical protein